MYAGLLVLRHTFLPEWWTKVLALLGLIRRSWRFWRFRRCVSGPGVPALFWQSRRSRRYDGCPGVSGAQLAIPTIQMPRALRPVQSLDRVSSPTQLKVDRVFFSNPKEMTERRKNDEVFGLYRRKVSKTIVFGKQCEMKTQRTCMYS